MATTQDGRLLAVHTPLGKDFLLLNRFTAVEGLSQLFRYELELVHEENEVGFSPTEVDPASLLGQAMTVVIAQRDGVTREFTGMVNNFAASERDTRFSYYRATLVPQVWLLTQNRNSRIFQQKSVPDILKEIFSDFEVSWQIQQRTDKRNYCVQYRESDFDFASRLMEEEGIYFYFEHFGGKHKMIFANTAESHSDTPSKSSIPFYIDPTRSSEDLISTILSFNPETSVKSGKVTVWDYNFQLPKKKLDFQQQSIFSIADNQKLEIYDYPGGYARRFDGIDRGGGESGSELQKADSEKENAARFLMDMLDSGVHKFFGSSDCASLTAGYKFQLKEHPISSLNCDYVITSISHFVDQSPGYITEDHLDQPYRSEFDCIKWGSGAPKFRPERTTAKPVIPGVQTAFVVGPAGEEIFTDKYGRVKVQFHWDREGNLDENSSCWVRVAQSWAGNRWGSMFIPRIGMEVIVHFIDGDPDQPIITGCVYNPQTMPPYTLPDEKTKSGVKSDSSKGGGGFNEFRIEDKKGSEQIFVHGQKDLDVRILNDAKEFIKRDRHLIVEGKQHELVGGDKHLKVKGNRNEKVLGGTSLDTDMDIDTKAGMNYAVDAGMGVHINGGMNVVVEAGVALTLKVGGNFININTAGIFVTGTMVMINSGGAAGSGSGCNPTAPVEPAAADTADAGEAAPRYDKPPPLKPSQFSALGKVLSQASGSGRPFCAI